MFDAFMVIVLFLLVAWPLFVGLAALTGETVFAAIFAPHRFEAVRWRVRNVPTRLRGWRAEFCDLLGLGCVARLEVTIRRASGEVLRLGIVSKRVVTNAGVGFIIDAFQNLVELEAMNFHACGTGVVAEAVGDTALGAEVETRVSGTQSEPASNQYRTVGTQSMTATRAVTEHGLLSASTAGVLFDRSVFAAINVVNGDSIQWTYTLTLTAGG